MPPSFQAPAYSGRVRRWVLRVKVLVTTISVLGTGHTFRARPGRTWAPKGHPPVLRRVSKRREVSSMVLIRAPLDGAPL